MELELFWEAWTLEHHVLCMPGPDFEPVLSWNGAALLSHPGGPTFPSDSVQNTPYTFHKLVKLRLDPVNLQLVFNRPSTFGFYHNPLHFCLGA